MIQIPLSQSPRGDTIRLTLKYSKTFTKNIKIGVTEYSAKRLSILKDLTLYTDNYRVVYEEDKDRIILINDPDGEIYLPISTDITLDGTDVNEETSEKFINFIKFSTCRLLSTGVKHDTYYVPLVIRERA